MWAIVRLTSRRMSNPITLRQQDHVGGCPLRIPAPGALRHSPDVRGAAGLEVRRARPRQGESDLPRRVPVALRARPLGAVHALPPGEVRERFAVRRAQRAIAAAGRLKRQRALAPHEAQASPARCHGDVALPTERRHAVILQRTLQQTGATRAAGVGRGTSDGEGGGTGGSGRDGNRGSCGQRAERACER